MPSREGGEGEEEEENEHHLGISEIRARLGATTTAPTLVKRFGLSPRLSAPRHHYFRKCLGVSYIEPENVARQMIAESHKRFTLPTII